MFGVEGVAHELACVVVAEDREVVGEVLGTHILECVVGCAGFIHNAAGVGHDDVVEPRDDPPSWVNGCLG